jgi:hypothetical protein
MGKIAVSAPGAETRVAMASKLFDLLLIAAALIYLYAWVIIIIDAFDCGVTVGLSAIFVPLYVHVFMFTRFEHARRALLIVMMLIFPTLATARIYQVASNRYLAQTSQVTLKESPGAKPQRVSEGAAVVREIEQCVLRHMMLLDKVKNPKMTPVPIPGHPGQFTFESGDAFQGPTELPPSAGPVPALLSQVSGKPYQSTPDDWGGSWRKLRFSLNSPQRFQYEWVRLSATSGAARASADLDGDGVAEVTLDRAITCEPKSIGGSQFLACRSVPQGATNEK